jgi:hypothetical protein
VLLPRHGDQGRFRRLLHDQTGRDLFAALNRLPGVNVAIVHPPLTSPPAHELPASRHARRHPDLRS